MKIFFFTICKIQRNGRKYVASAQKEKNITGEIYWLLPKKSTNMNIKINSLYDDENPPWPYVHLVAKHACTSLETYIVLWRLKDHGNKVILEKSKIFLDVGINLDKFKREIVKLNSLLLLNFSEDLKGKKYFIELVGWSFEDEDELEF